MSTWWGKGTSQCFSWYGSTTYKLKVLLLGPQYSQYVMPSVEPPVYEWEWGQKGEPSPISRISGN